MPAALFSSLLSNERHECFIGFPQNLIRFAEMPREMLQNSERPGKKFTQLCEQKIMKNEMNFARLRKPQIGNFLRGYMLTITMLIPAHFRQSGPARETRGNG